MNTNITIAIVTFKQRAELVKKLVAQIRESVPDTVDIMLAVNGNNEEEMPDEYRQEMLDLAKHYKSIYPIICPEFKSLCKLWNTLIIFSKTEYIFVICDDVSYENPKALSIIDSFIKNTESEFFTINYGFSHFVLTKNIMHKLGYFDERLCGFGEEDGDIVHRYIEVYGQRMLDIEIPGLFNKASYELRSENIETHIDNKPKFNREFAGFKYKPDPTGIKGMSPVPIVKVLEDYQQYPYEQFVKNNKHNISKFEKVILDE